MYNIGAIALARLLPKLNEYFKGWKPLENPKYGADLMAKCKSLLSKDRARDGALFDDMDNNPFDKAVTETVCIWFKKRTFELVLIALLYSTGTRPTQSCGCE